MTPSAKRAKAKLLVEWVVNRLKVIFPDAKDTDIIVPPTSEHGEDIKYSPEFAEIIGVSFECKNQKGYAHAYKDMEQTVKNSNGRTPVLVVKAPYKDPLVIMRWEDYEKGLGL